MRKQTFRKRRNRFLKNDKNKQNRTTKYLYFY